MIIARAVENEWRDGVRELAIKLFDQARRCAKTQTRPPFECLNRWQLKRFAGPRVVQL